MLGFPGGRVLYTNQSTTKDFAKKTSTTHPCKAPGDLEGGFMLGRCMFHLSVGSVGKVLGSAGHRVSEKAGGS